RKAPGYKGDLARPFAHIAFNPTVPLGLLGGKAALDNAVETEERRFIESFTAQVMSKMPALFRHYAIEDGNYPALATRLAVAHVPGCSMAAAPAGAPRLWTDFDVALLRLHIEVTKQEKTGRSFAEAARIVARGKLWSKRLRRPGTSSGETLRRRALRADP